MADVAEGRPVFRVLLLARYGLNGASSRVRHYAFLPGLRGAHVCVTPHWIIDDANLENAYRGRRRTMWPILSAYARRLMLLLSARRFDFIWVEKEALPFVPAWFERWMLRRTRVPTIVDFDDLWILRHAAGARGTEVRKLRRLVDAAAEITVANAFLAGALFRLTGRRALVMENCIEAAPYVSASEAASRRRSSGARPRIGWIGTPLTADRYLPAIAQVLNAMHEEGLSETVLIGAGSAASQVVAERLPWHLDGEADAVAGLDIGIQPLIGSAFDKCKSGWKIYQYMAAGKAVVASRIGFNAELIEDGVTGFLVDSAAEFDQRLRLLLADAHLRAEMGARAQAMILDRYDIDRGIEERMRLFRRLAA